MIDTYAAGRRLQIGDGWREPGQLVPEAHTWFRLQDWLHAGYLKDVQVDEKTFRAALASCSPADTAEILNVLGLGERPVPELPRRRDQAPQPLKTRTKTKTAS